MGHILAKAGPGFSATTSALEKGNSDSSTLKSQRKFSEFLAGPWECVEKHRQKPTLAT